MKVHLVFFGFLIFVIHESVSGQHIETDEILQEADIGQNIVIKCHSNDASHVFLFWHIQKHGYVLGPSNKYDEEKYNYEAVSGNLTVRGTSTNDEGLYNCVCRGIETNDILTSSVRLLIRRDWEEVYETDADTNLVRACAALTIILGMLIIVYVAMKLRRKYSRDYFHFEAENDEEEDDSTEELFNRSPSTSGIKKSTLSTKSPDDFEKVYTTINMTDNV